MPFNLTVARSSLTALLLVLPVLASADAALTYGSGPDEYHSYAFKADAGIFDLPLQLELDYFRASSAGVSDMKETGAGLTWNATQWLSANFRRSFIEDGTFEVNGNEGGFSFGLDTLWESDLRTTLDVGYGAFDYAPTSITRAKLASKLTLTQHRKSIGLSQDITPAFSIYAAHDRYEYERYETFNRDLKALALVLFRRTPNIAKAAFTLISFPDKTNTLGMRWEPQEKLALDISSGKTTTILEQELKSTRLGAELQISDKFSLSAAITRSNSTALIGPLGKVYQAETSNTYTEFNAGWAF